MGRESWARRGRVIAWALAGAVAAGTLIAAWPAVARQAGRAGVLPVISSPVPATRDAVARDAVARDAFESVSCTGASFCVAVGGDRRGALAERWDGRRWTVMRGAKGGALRSISCVSTTFCMAVSDTYAEQWNGRTWLIRRGLTADMVNVSCPGRRFCMAVGSDRLHEENTAAVWRGIRWRAVAVPQNGCVPYCGLNDVSCRRYWACVAVGSAYSDDDQADEATGDAWNGHKWRYIGTVSKDIAPAMSGVSCVGADFCLAVGEYQSEVGPCTECVLAGAWNGQSWLDVTPSTSGSLTGVSCADPGRCLAVGAALAVRFTGPATWRRLTISGPGGAQPVLAQVSCWRPRACIAVGGYRASGGATLTLAERWNGTTWRALRTPSP